MKISFVRTAILYLAVVFIAVVSAGTLSSFEGESALARIILWLISVVLLVRRLKQLRGTPVASRTTAAWGWLAVACLLMFGTTANSLYGQSLAACAIFALCMGTIEYFYGPGYRKQLLLPLFVLIAVMPALPFIRDWLSLPLRTASAHLAAAALALCGADVVCCGTEITIGARQLAITAACSGITFFETMLWVAWLAVLLRHPPGCRRLLHYSFLIPVVILGNAVRVALLTATWLRYGTEILSGPLHLWLGYLAITLAAALFMLLEALTSPRPARGSHD